MKVGGVKEISPPKVESPLTHLALSHLLSPMSVGLFLRFYQKVVQAVYGGIW